MKKSDILGTLPIDTLLFKLSAPIMLSMFIQGLYNIVDSIFVAKISEEALTAVSIAFPVQNTFVAIAVGTAVGVNANASKLLGQKEARRARAFGENGIILSIIYWLIFLVFGLFFTGNYMDLQTSDPTVRSLGVDYLRIVSCFSLGIFSCIVAERILQATGKSMITMMAQGLGAITNIVLDPILIFGLCGLPAMGIRGAAYATVIGQILAASIDIILNQILNKELEIRSLKPNLDIIRGIYKVGFPSILLISISSFSIFMLNRIVKPFSETAIGMLGIYFKVQSVIMMPIFGLTNGMIPILAYNYGAARSDRMKETMKKSLIIGEVMMCIAPIALGFFTREIFSLFNPGPYMLEIGIPAFRIMGISYIFTGICVVSSSIFQGLGNGKTALYLIVVRQLILLLPLAYLFASLGKLEGVWYSFILSEMGGVIYSFYFLKNFAFKKANDLEKELLEDLDEDSRS